MSWWTIGTDKGSASFPGLWSRSKHRKWNEHLRWAFCINRATLAIVINLKGQTTNNYLKNNKI